MSGALAPARTTFTLPEKLHATEPPEARGVPRDQVRLLVAQPDGLEHTRFEHIKDLLVAGDVVVVNTSATLPAAVDGIRLDGRPVVVHFSSPLRGGLWVIELRGAEGPLPEAAAGDVVYLPGDVRIDVLAAYPDAARDRSRLWRAHIEVDAPVEDYLACQGRPIAYGYLHDRWPLSAYQTIFARQRGSAEMPSAARPFTQRLIIDLIVRGINVAPVLLHTGVSSLESGEPPQEERYEVPPSTSRLVNETRRARGRVIAVGTSVTRALETVAGPHGTVASGRGRTNLVLGTDRPARAVDAIITGWHEPKASHLSLLEAVAGAEMVQRAYDAALGAGYLWHEFGDSCLLLPHPRARRAKLRRVT
ncbi:MAG: S-adenosylmethionine:tRNA ribosyltransferase-isomerase [Actinomycetota bacterium]